MDFASILDSAISGVIPGPRKIVIYGGPGIGKTTWASMAPAPIIIQTEEGSNDLDVTRLPLCQTFTDFVNQLTAIAQGDHQYKTVVIDSIDWTERLISQEVARQFGKSSIEEVGYGHAYGPLKNKYDAIFRLLASCYQRGMHSIVIGHAQKETYANPETDSYDRWTLRLHKTTRPMVMEWATEVLFATRSKPIVTKEDQGFDKFRGIAANESLPRILRTADRPFCEAKNRLGLPEELPLDWREFAKYIPE